MAQDDWDGFRVAAIRRAGIAGIAVGVDERNISSPDADKQASRHAYRLLMTASETVIIGWLQVPPKAVPSRWPEHEVAGQLSGERVCRFAVLFQVTHCGPTPSMNSAFPESVHGFLRRKSVSHSVEFRV